MMMITTIVPADNTLAATWACSAVGGVELGKDQEQSSIWDGSGTSTSSPG